MLKTAKELQPGDKVHARAGGLLTVKSIGPGMSRGHVLVNWREHIEPPWSNIWADAMIDANPTT